MAGQSQVVRLMVDDQRPPASNVRAIRVKNGESPNILGCEERFQTFIESVTDYAIYMLDPAGNVKTWNLGAQRIKGYEAAEILGQHFSKFYLEADIAQGKPKQLLEVAALVGRYADEGYRVRKDGSTFWASVVLTAVHDSRDNLLGFLKITRDLTERRKGELALFESEQLLRAMVNGIVGYGVIRLDPLGIVTTWNTGAERMMRYAAADVIGKDYSCFFLPDEVTAGLPAHHLEVAAAVDSFSTECWHQRSDGSRLWVEITISSLRDTNGKLTGYAKVTRDLTERKVAEEKIRELQRDLERRNASLTKVNADLEVFSRAMAHDLRAPVRHILAYTDILLKEFAVTLPAEAFSHVAHIKGSAERMVDLVRDLMGWFAIASRAPNLEYVDLQPLVKSVVDEFAAEALNRDIEWRIGDLFAVHCDRGLTLLVFQNLIGNALKFTGKRSRAVIEIGHVVTDSERVIFVRDNGAGFNMQYVSKLFEPFQRLHSYSEFEGTGLGLSIVSRIVQKHRGRIWADATPGGGATFSFTLEERAIK